MDNFLVTFELQHLGTVGWFKKAEQLPVPYHVITYHLNWYFKAKTMKFRRSYNMRLCVSCKTTTTVKRTAVLLSKLLQGRATSQFSLKLYLGTRIVWMMKTLFFNLLQVGKILHRDKWLPMSLLHSSNLTSFLLPLNSPHSPNSRHLTCKKQAAISLLISHLHFNNLVIAWRRDKYATFLFCFFLLFALSCKLNSLKVNQ